MGRLPVRVSHWQSTCMGWRESHARCPVGEKARRVAPRQGRKLVSTARGDALLRSQVADSFTYLADLTRGTRFRFECFVSCLRHHPKPSGAGFACRRQTELLRSGGPLRLRASAHRRAQRTDCLWRGGLTPRFAAPVTPLRYSSEARTAPRPCCLARSVLVPETSETGGRRYSRRSHAPRVEWRLTKGQGPRLR